MSPASVSSEKDTVRVVVAPVRSSSAVTVTPLTAAAGAANAPSSMTVASATATAIVVEFVFVSNIVQESGWLASDTVRS